MNGVDIVDESTKVNVTSRKVSKISTLIYTYVLDLDMSNTYYIYLFIYILLYLIKFMFQENFKKSILFTVSLFEFGQVQYISYLRHPVLSVFSRVSLHSCFSHHGSITSLQYYVSIRIYVDSIIKSYVAHIQDFSHEHRLP